LDAHDLKSFTLYSRLELDSYFIDLMTHLGMLDLL